MSFGTPIYVINDIDTVRQVLVRDFHHFADRRVLDSDKNLLVNRIFARMLLSLKGDEWRLMRSKMSPVFTSGKLKSMTGLLDRAGDNLVKYMHTMAEGKKEFNAKETMTFYSLDTIISCGFGVESDSFHDQDGVLGKMVKKIVQPGGTVMLKFMLMMISPRIAKALKITFMDKEATLFFYNMVKATMKSRRESGERRNDFVDYMLEALKDEAIKDENMTQFEKEAEVKSSKKLNLSEDQLESDLVSNSLLFIIAGFDTGSTVLSIMMTMFAKNPEEQERLYQEIKETIEENDGKLDYDTVQGMQLLEAAIHESIRFWPVFLLERICTKEYKVPGTDFVIEKDAVVQVPSSAFHRDEQFFPYPKEFNLDNFSADAKANRSPYAYLGFGQGPRNCVGMRFALLQVKYAIIRLFLEFKVVCGPNSPKGEMKVEPRSMSGQPIGGAIVMVEKRETS